MPTPTSHPARTQAPHHRSRPSRPGALRTVVGALLAAVLATGTVVAGGTAAQAALPGPKPTVPMQTAPEAPSRYQGQVTCDPTEKPGPAAMRELLRRTYGKANAGGTTRSCTQGSKSEHKEGRAYDWMLNAYDPRDREIGDSFVTWLTGPDAQGVKGGRAHRLGIQYVIWNERMWSSWDGAWEPYTGYSPHTDHVHISFSWDGAYKRTSWWTGRAVTKVDHGPCPLYVGELAAPYSGPNYEPCPKPAYRIDGAVSADFDGDGRTDIGTYRDGKFTLKVNGSTTTFSFGAKGDVPVAGDWDGDGKAGIGVFRNGTWYLRNSATAGTSSYVFAYGTAGDKPVVGDWDGDGRVGVGVVRDATWILKQTVGQGPATIKASFGKASDIPVVGDWDGDGDDSAGIYRRGYWVLASTPAGGHPRTAVTSGHATSISRPLVGDWDRNGTTTLGTMRLTEHWFTNNANGSNRQASWVPY
jgi:hypothetical protein